MTVGFLSRFATKKGIARKIMLGYVTPLLVLLVAGLLIPVFLWAFAARYRGEFAARKELVSRVSILVHAAQDIADEETNRQRFQDDKFRKRQGEARISYLERRQEIQVWFEDHPDLSLQNKFSQVDSAFKTWDRRDKRTPEGFIAVHQGFEGLMTQVTKARDSYEPLYQLAESLRWIALLLFPLIALTSALLIGRAIALSITEPLVALAHAAERLEHHTLTAIDLPEDNGQSDELGELRRAFRRMMEAVIQREQALENRSEALAATGRRLESVLNATNDGIALLDREGVFTLVNPRFAALFGLESEDLRGGSFARLGPRLLSLFKPRDRQVAHQRLREVLRDREATVEETYALARPLPRVLRFYSTPVRDTEGFIGRIVVLRDVTREIEADRLKSEFASTVSHELRTPLTAISGNVALLLGEKAGPLTADQREFLNLTRSSAERLTDLINEMLDLSRLESGGLPMRQVSVDCGPLLSRIVRTLQEQARLRGLNLTAIIPESLPAVLGDPDRIAQVVMNLISNALKYTPSGGKIMVRLIAEESQLALKVSDTGIGIASEDRARLFSKFFRADNSTTRSIGGTGLGLAISKAIIERLGGRIWVESTPSVGSTFTVTLPLATGEPQEVASENAPRSNGPRRLALLVHDQTSVLHRLNHSLSQQGMIVSAAANPEETLRRARGLRPDVLLLSPFTTAFDALQLLQDLRANPLTERLIVVLYQVRGIGNSFEFPDTLALAPPQKVEAALAQLKTDTHAPHRPLVVLGTQALHANVRNFHPRQSASPVVSCQSRDELTSKVGQLCPLALVCDTAELDGRTLGLYLRQTLKRHVGLRVPLLLVGELGTRTRLLVPQGTGPVSLDRFAEAVNEAIAIL